MVRAIQDDALFLSQMRLFGNVDDSALMELAHHLKPRRYRKGETIFHEDDPPGSLFLVKAGLVKVQLSSNDGKHITIAWVRPFNFFGTLGCVRDLPRPEAAMALEATDVLVLGREEFREFLRVNPDAALNFVDLLAERWQSGLELLQDVAFLDVPARLAKVLLRHTQRTRSLLMLDEQECFHSPNQAELAALVGATRESVNKWVQRFAQQGSIVCKGKSIRVVDEEALGRYLN